MSEIHVWSYLRTLEEEREETWQAIEQVLRSGRLILGPSVKAFEAEFSAYCGASYGVGVANGTDAITLALRALGVGPGDEVITVSNTAVPTVSAIVTAGATPRFVDVDPVSYLMDVEQLRSAITSRTKCILPVHLYGQCVDMDAVRRVSERHHLLVVEDCAQSHGASRLGKMAGSMSDAAAFSFYPTKILGGYGDGGMVVTNREDVAAKLRRLRFYGMETSYYALEHGHNSRLDELHAEILRRKLTHLDAYVERRRQLAERYREQLAETSLVLPHEAAGNRHAYYLYVVRHPRRDDLLRGLGERGIFVNVSYPHPIHLMEGYQNLGYREGDLPATESAAREVFSLPLYPALANDEQDWVCAALREILGQG